MKNPLLALIDQGQSYWLDDLSRGMIADGTLARRASEEGLRGVTSNPTIFEKAFRDGAHYRDRIAAEAARLGSVGEIYEKLVTDDVRDACDVLRPVYDATSGRDGFVSLEVSPHLARKTQASIDEAHRLWRVVDRPNLMIKIPGTIEGAPAIEALLHDGINVNVTLLFSVESYERVAAAHQRALGRRLAEGRPIDRMASVASFFLSRIDTLVDKHLADQPPPGKEAEAKALMGRVAVANAKMAYRSFSRMRQDERWQALERAGARVQRLLWASTSTKNPNYRDVMYVEPLIGPDTINTMPESTIAAFRDHGRVASTLAEGLDEAERVMKALPGLGIDFTEIAAELEDDGIAKFAASFDAAVKALGEQVERLRHEHAPAE